MSGPGPTASRRRLLPFGHPDRSEGPARVRIPLWSRRAVSVHVTLLVLLPAFAALTWWQVHRALSGNELSWAYVFEWPVFGAYAVYVWWMLLHEEAGSAGGTAPGAGDGGGDGHDPRHAPDAPEHDRDGRRAREDEELAAYNRYLAELDALDPPKRW